MHSLPSDEIQKMVRMALAEDIGSGDATTLATVPEETAAVGYLVARESLVTAGLELAEITFQELSPDLRVEVHLKDGHAVEKGTVLMTISGPARPLLTAERVALNFVQRLSGIATLTSKFVQAAQGTSARILDTRKTTPGWRLFEKYAVQCGGGFNHRFGLFDQILIKDNHLAAIGQTTENPIRTAVQRARQKFPHLKIEVETDTIEQVQQALEAGAQIILLDNMPLETLRAAVRLINHRAQTEASGGITLQSVRDIAETGVDFISSGALTHSAKAMDLSLDFTLPPHDH
jgi:nicotinate-nucleotide pyrophosphorylase (carboxylating)